MATEDCFELKHDFDFEFEVEDDGAIEPKPLMRRMHAQRAPKPLAYMPRGDPAALAVWRATKAHKDLGKVREVLFEAFGDVCRLCETAIPRDAKHGRPDSPQIDHVDFKSDSGPWIWDNLRLTHANCNARRNDESRGLLRPEIMRQRLADDLMKHDHPQVWADRLHAIVVEDQRYLEHLIARQGSASEGEREAYDEKIDRAILRRNRDRSDYAFFVAVRPELSSADPLIGSADDPSLGPGAEEPRLR